MATRVVVGDGKLWITVPPLQLTRGKSHECKAAMCDEASDGGAAHNEAVRGRATSTAGKGADSRGSVVGGEQLSTNGRNGFPSPLGCLRRRLSDEAHLLSALVPTSKALVAVAPWLCTEPLEATEEEAVAVPSQLCTGALEAMPEAVVAVTSWLCMGASAETTYPACAPSGVSNWFSKAPSFLFCAVLLLTLILATGNPQACRLPCATGVAMR